MFGVIGFLRRNFLVLYPPTVAKQDKPLKFGILGAANIAPNSLISPAKSHPEVEVYAVAARDKTRAEAYAKKYGISKAFGSYQDLLDDPDVDVVYNPLPNGLHYEWSIKTLLSGKNLLLEKPSTNTADETRRIFELAEKKGLVVLEAFHYRFHPAVRKAKDILESGELGKIKNVETTLCIAGVFDAKAGTNIRFQHSLGGGALMDAGCYTVSSIRYIAGNPISVDKASFTPFPQDPKIDLGVDASLTFPNDVTGSIKCNIDGPKTLGILPHFDFDISVQCTKGSLKVHNYIGPHHWHSIKIKPDGMHERTVKAYTFEDGNNKGEIWWASYRHQLEAFVDQVKGRTPRTWVEKDDSIDNMVWIEKIYEKLGIGSRPASTYKIPDEGKA